jgi:hypothetical protein
MNYNDLNYTYAQLMRAAERACNRKEALDIINKATQVRAAAQAIKSQPPINRYERWCGGPGGFDDYAERLH